MKKTIITLAILFGLGLGAYAQGGLFQYGAVSDEDYYGAGYGYQDRNSGLLSLPNTHGSTNDYNSTPLGSGALLLIGFGAAYMLKKRIISQRDDSPAPYSNRLE